MRNIELKARLRDWKQAVDACRRIGATPEGAIRQKDTYFNVPEGRFKLRQSEPAEDYLVFYRRPDIADAKACDYYIAAADRSIEPVLSAALGQRAVVEKVRSLYMYENVRIHLDHVEDLGDFIEFEAVLSAGNDDQDGFDKVARLRAAFRLDIDDILESSYLDMMLARG